MTVIAAIAILSYQKCSFTSKTTKNYFHYELQTAVVTDCNSVKLCSRIYGPGN